MKFGKKQGHLNWVLPLNLFMPGKEGREERRLEIGRSGGEETEQLGMKQNRRKGNKGGDKG